MTNSYNRTAMKVLAVLLVLAAAIIVWRSATAGQVDLAWDPVSGVTSYKVYRGDVSGTYIQSLDVGNVTTFSITDATDCQPGFYASKAVDGALESLNFSNEVDGWPQPTIASIVTNGFPDNILGKGSNVQEFSGNNYQPSAVRYLDALGQPWLGVAVTQATTASCSAMTVDVTVGPGAQRGLATVEIEGADGVWARFTDAVMVEPSPGQVKNMRRPDKL